MNVVTTVGRSENKVLEKCTHSLYSRESIRSSVGSSIQCPHISTMHLHFLNGHPDTEIHNSHPLLTSQLSLSTFYLWCVGVISAYACACGIITVPIINVVHVHTQPTTKCLPEIRQV